MDWTEQGLTSPLRAFLHTVNSGAAATIFSYYFTSSLSTITPGKIGPKSIGNCQSSDFYGHENLAKNTTDSITQLRCQLLTHSWAV